MRFFNSSTMSWILSESVVTRQGTNRERDNAAHDRANNELAVEEGEDTWNKKERANKLHFKACHAKSCCDTYDILIRQKTNLKHIQQPEYFLMSKSAESRSLDLSLWPQPVSLRYWFSIWSVQGLLMLNANHGSDHHTSCQCIFATAKHFVGAHGDKDLLNESVSNSKKVPWEVWKPRLQVVLYQRSNVHLEYPESFHLYKACLTCCIFFYLIMTLVDAEKSSLLNLFNLLLSVKFISICIWSQLF